MNPMLEPFMYEAATQHQSELRETSRPVTAAGDRETPRPRCIRLRWCLHDRLTAVPVSR